VKSGSKTGEIRKKTQRVEGFWQLDTGVNDERTAGQDPGREVKRGDGGGMCGYLVEWNTEHKMPCQINPNEIPVRTNERGDDTRCPGESPYRGLSQPG